MSYVFSSRNDQIDYRKLAREKRPRFKGEGDISSEKSEDWQSKTVNETEVGSGLFNRGQFTVLFVFRGLVVRADRT